MSPATADCSTRSWTSVSMRCPPGRAEQRDLVARQVAFLEDPVADRVVDVVVDVRDPVDDAHDLALERRRLLRTGVREDPVDHLACQVEPLGDACRLLVVAEAALVAEQLVERGLTRVAERRVTRVVAETDRFRQVFVQAECARDDAGDAGRLERVRHARAVVVARGVDEDLRLALQPPERLRVDDAVAVALERRADTALGLVARPSRASRRSGRRAARARAPPARGCARRRRRQLSRQRRARGHGSCRIR